MKKILVILLLFILFGCSGKNITSQEYHNLIFDFYDKVGQNYESAKNKYWEAKKDAEHHNQHYDEETALYNVELHVWECTKLNDEEGLRLCEEIKEEIAKFDKKYKILVPDVNTDELDELIQKFRNEGYHLYPKDQKLADEKAKEIKEATELCNKKIEELNKASDVFFNYYMAANMDGEYAGDYSSEYDDLVLELESRLGYH